jgi:hypothetical protein
MGWWGSWLQFLSGHIAVPDFFEGLLDASGRDAHVRQGQRALGNDGVEFHQLHLIARERGMRQRLSHPGESVPGGERDREYHACLQTAARATVRSNSPKV